MAKKVEEKKKEVIKKNPTKFKIVVEQGRAMMTPIIEHKVLYTEVVANKEITKTREKELREEYKDIEGLSIVSFSL